MGKCFFENHANSKVFQNNSRPQAFFVNILCQVGDSIFIASEVLTMLVHSPSVVQRILRTRWGASSLIGWIGCVGGWVEGLDRILNGSFNYLYTLWVYRTCIRLLIYMFKNYHQHCYGFEILMTSWGFWVLFSKHIWWNVFLKNHIKSKVYQINSRPQAFFVKFWCQIGELGYGSRGRKHRPLEVSTKPLHLPPWSSARFTLRERCASLNQ